VLSTKEFERDLADLGPDKFEQLVFAIVRREHPNAQKLKAPDFGADVLDDPAGKRPRVWQVKHYPGDIHWTDCGKSLNRAVAKWRPAEITFVFPRDLTGKDHQDFNDKLIADKPVPAKRWTATELNDKLDQYPAIRRSFFPHRTDALHQVLRAAKLTERPADGPAFLEHGLDLAELAEELDPNFDYVVMARPQRLAQPFTGPAPFMTVTASAGGRESMLAAYFKPEAKPELPTWSFTEDEAGDAAREALHLALARGTMIQLTGGITVRASPAPAAIAKILDEVRDQDEGQITLTVRPPEKTVELEVRLDDKPALPPLCFEMQAAPPKPGHDGSWVGLASGVLLYLGFNDHGAGSVTIHFTPTMDLGPNAAANAAAVETLIDLLTGPLHLFGPLVAGEASLDLRSAITDEDLNRLRFLREVYAAVIEIEARTGARIQIPPTIGIDNARDTLELADLLRRRTATGEANLTTTFNIRPDQADALAMRLADSRQIVVPYETDLMDHTIRFGWARISFEHITARLRPPMPDGLAGVRVEAHGAVEMQLIDEPLPSDVAFDPASGRWGSALLPR